LPTGDQRLQFSLNHVTAPGLPWRDLVDLAADLGCVGVEFRTDLPQPLFGQDPPEEVAAHCAAKDIRILALAEISHFNDIDDAKLGAVAQLARTARRAGAPAIILIPRVAGGPAPLDQICTALHRIGNVLADEGMRGLVEPIGFAESSLREAALARHAIRETHGPKRFGIIHDTFHHHLAGGGPLSSEMVEIVHVSGVAREADAAAISDADRGLVDGSDRLGTVDQLRALAARHSAAPISVEAFSPLVQTNTDPRAALERTLEFITTSLGQTALSPRRDGSPAPVGVPA